MRTMPIEMSNWKPADIQWARFEPSLVDPDIVKLVKAASMVEYNAMDYAAYLRKVFAGDPAFQVLALEWAEFRSSAWRNAWPLGETRRPGFRPRNEL